MEEILHYVWKHKLFPLKQMITTDGRSVEVINPGFHNTDAGPDFLDAKIKIEGIEWVGNVEIHLKASDWYLHHHNVNKTYDNVILHVVEQSNCDVSYPDGTNIPQLIIPIPEHIKNNYETLVTLDYYPRCKKIIGNISLLLVHNWLSALQIERLELRTHQIKERLKQCEYDWEHTLFVTMARNFGFGINGDAFESWAYTIPKHAINKHRNDLFQIEAILFGQAGLLEDSAIPDVYKQNITQDDYYQRLKHEYNYLRHKFNLTHINPHIWKFLRLHPQNFPHIRIAQIAMMWYEQKSNFSKFIEATSIAELRDLLDSHVSQYWKCHYTFASTKTPEIEKGLTNVSKDLIIINTIVPILFAYGKHKYKESLCERAINLLEELKPENNHFVREWAEAGIVCQSAADSQAIIQLTKQYCQPHECLRCRFGYEFIRHTPDFLKEK